MKQTLIEISKVLFFVALIAIASYLKGWDGFFIGLLIYLVFAGIGLYGEWKKFKNR